MKVYENSLIIISLKMLINPRDNNVIVPLKNSLSKFSKVAGYVAESLNKSNGNLLIYLVKCC